MLVKNKKRKKCTKKRECLICTDNISETNKVVLQCCHIYHSECVKMLVEKRTRKCPLCRTRITWNLKQLNKHNELTKKKYNKIEE